MNPRKMFGIGLFTIAGTLLVLAIVLALICASLLFGAGNDTVVYLLWKGEQASLIVFATGAAVSFAALVIFVYKNWTRWIENIEIAYGPRGPQNIIGTGIGLLMVLCGFALAVITKDGEFARLIVKDGLIVIGFILAVGVFNFFWDHWLVQYWSKIRK